jgi:DNA-binding HxlR family transcriptional regulator
VRTDRLIDLFERKYAVLVLADLARMDGAKVVTLAHALDASRGAIRATLDELVERKWVRRNPGYGHPLRPEYVLTKSGARMAERCAELDELLRLADARDVATRKWAMPVLFSIGERGGRFSEIAAHLPGVTDRALSHSLTDLAGADLATRSVLDRRPPTTWYRPTDEGLTLLPALARLA